MIKKAKNLYYSLDDKLVEEKVEFLRGAKFLYENFLGKFLRCFLRNRLVARLCGTYQNSAFSKRKILPFIKKHNIDITEFEKDVSSFKSFNDFFVRKLKPGARLIASGSNILVSSADSKLFVIPDISKDVHFFVKNEKFNLRTFLKDRDLAHQYHNGTLMLFRLAPYDYHRFHFPTDCVATKLKIIHGAYESVNPIAYRAGVQPLLKNERHLVVLKTEEFGEVIMVLVGAMFVGKIVHTYTPEKRYDKGEEMGYFAFGGSTIAMLFKNGEIEPKEMFLQHSAQGYETEIKMGQAIND
jgi:phosphatidylserine decarboxylase